ncbi:solute carrier family 25 member 45 isoform X2 [Culicoides brevitarsis]|uniref:solute carrier family 25 member 45 isoform X2 n=1 Tax=Culicoides brevitarsis TaxID=469753 RepID=UPI00307CAAAB
MAILTDTACDFVAGCFGGACGVLIGHPLDTIKTWQQKLNATVGQSVYHILHHRQKDGYNLHGFYRGMHFPLVCNGAINSVVFAVYGNHLRNLEKNLSEEERLKRRNKNVILSGMVAGFIQSYLICPVELIKIRLQTRIWSQSISWKILFINMKQKFDKQWSNKEISDRIPAVAYAKYIFQTEGLNGFYRGITPTLCRDVLPYGIYMATYDVFLDIVEHSFDVEKRDSVSKSSYSGFIAISGSIAGLMSWLFVVPFDVVKTKMQAETDPNKHPTMLQTAKEVWKRGGIQALIRGTLSFCLSFPCRKIYDEIEQFDAKWIKKSLRKMK